MKFRVMKALDACVGGPLCVLAALAACVVARRKTLPSSPRRITVYKWFGLGTLTLLQPLLRGIKARYPEARLTVCTFAHHAELLRLYGCCDEVRTVRADTLAHFCADALRLFLAGFRVPSDIAFDAEFYSNFSALCAFCSGAPLRIGFSSRQWWRTFLITHPLTLDAATPMRAVYEEAGRCCDVREVPLTIPRPRIPEGAYRKAEAVVRATGGEPGERLLGINVNADSRMLARRWPAGHFVRLIEALALRYPRGLRMVLTGTSDERAYTQSLYARLGAQARSRTAVVAGALEIAEFLALVERFDLVLTNDSGPLHCAMALGVPSVSLWGPSSPQVYAPADRQRHRVLSLGYACSPCMNRPDALAGAQCRGRIPCLAGIGVQTVLAAVEEMMGQTLRNRATISPCAA